MKKLFEINILGQVYPIFEDTAENNDVLKKNDGYIDLGNRIIVLEKNIPNKKLKEHILKHELVHAFLIESGLDDQTFDAWAKNEEMIDWIALQLFKMSNTATEMLNKFEKVTAPKGKRKL